jgi:hypothetical protein
MPASEPSETPLTHSDFIRLLMKHEPVLRAYARTLLALPGMQAWYAAALAETVRDEPHEQEARAAGRWLQDLRAQPAASNSALGGR